MKIKSRPHKLAEKTAIDSQVPDDLITVAQITGAYGVQGWVRIRPYSGDPETLLTVTEWWLDKPVLHNVKALRTRLHADEVLARLSTIQFREDAEAAKGTLVRVSRSLFPQLDENEFYWVDLIGLKVVNLRGEQLGTVHDLMDNGVHQVLRVDAAEMAENAGKRRELLIPFIDKFVGKIDLAAATITVDWELDY
ncbi:MAG: ribosome maturation factor RimM [Betaproteobacteria bacterium]|nr:ribosome maturation factor RimM [Betaproteobacteria bacterium]